MCHKMSVQCSNKHCLVVSCTLAAVFLHNILEINRGPHLGFEARLQMYIKYFILPFSFLVSGSFSAIISSIIVLCAAYSTIFQIIPDVKSTRRKRNENGINFSKCGDLKKGISFCLRLPSGQASGRTFCLSAPNLKTSCCIRS